MTIGEVWRRAGDIESVLRRAMPSGLPYQPTSVARGVSTISGANYHAPPPPAPVVRMVLEQLAQAAGRILDFRTQSEVVALMEELDAATEKEDP